MGQGIAHSAALAGFDVIIYDLENSIVNKGLDKIAFNIKKGVEYPNVLLITGDSDDRVPPFHSYKFLANLPG